MAFGFDGVYEEPENTGLYRQHVKKVMQSAMDGINGTVFAYGQVRAFRSLQKPLFGALKGRAARARRALSNTDVMILRLLLPHKRFFSSLVFATVAHSAPSLGTSCWEPATDWRSVPVKASCSAQAHWLSNPPRTHGAPRFPCVLKAEKRERYGRRLVRVSTTSLRASGRAVYTVLCSLRSTEPAESKTCFLCAYQTGSGKTHAIMGTRAYPGVVSLAVADMFAIVEDPECDLDYSIRVGMLEIYNEELKDLLAAPEQRLHSGARLQV